MHSGVLVLCLLVAALFAGRLLFKKVTPAGSLNKARQTTTKTVAASIKVPGKILGNLGMFPLFFLPLIILRLLLGPTSFLSFVPNAQDIDWGHLISLPYSSVTFRWVLGLIAAWLVVAKAVTPNFYNKYIKLFPKETAFGLALNLALVLLAWTLVPYGRSWIPYVRNSTVLHPTVYVLWPHDVQKYSTRNPHSVYKNVEIKGGGRAWITFHYGWGMRVARPTPQALVETVCYYSWHNNYGQQGRTPYTPHDGSGCPARPSSLSSYDEISKIKVGIKNETRFPATLAFKYKPY